MNNRRPWQLTLGSLATPTPGNVRTEVAFFDTSGNPLFMVSAAPTGANILLTGYTAGAAGSLAAADSVNVAFRKLEARIVALESA